MNDTEKERKRIIKRINEIIDAHNLWSKRYYNIYGSTEEFYNSYFQEIFQEISLFLNKFEVTSNNKSDQKDRFKNYLDDLKHYKDVVGKYFSLTDSFMELKKDENKYSKTSDIYNRYYVSLILYYGVVTLFIWATTFLNNQIDHCYAIAYNLFSTSREGGLYWSFYRLLTNSKNVKYNFNKNKGVVEVRYEFEETKKKLGEELGKDISDFRNRSILTHGHQLLYSLVGIKTDKLKDRWGDLYEIICEVFNEKYSTSCSLNSNLNNVQNINDEFTEVKKELISFYCKIGDILKDIDVVRKFLIDRELIRIRNRLYDMYTSN